MLEELGEIETETLRRGVLASAVELDAEPGRRVDWNALLRSARQHRLEPLLREGWRRSGLLDGRPAFVREALENAWNRSVARTVVQLHHLEEIAELAREREADVYLLKGAALATATTVYAHPALRPMADLDLLVPPGELDRFSDAVTSIGYERRDVSDHAVAFVRRQSGIWLELHRSLTSCARFLELDTSELFARSLPAEGLSPPWARVLALEDQLLHLCLHASFQHGFRQPGINAWDQRRLASRSELDSDAFVARARRKALARWVYAGLALADAVFPSPELGALRARLEPFVPRRLARWAAGLSARRLLSSSRTVLFGSPVARIVWAGNPLKTLALLVEITRPRSGGGAVKPFPLFQRILQLAASQGVPEVRALLKQRFSPRLSPTSASLGEVRDV